MATKRSKDEIKQAVRKHYGDAITSGAGCCGAGPSNINTAAGERYAALAGYTREELESMPDSVTTFGCGNPVNVADIRTGQTVLDLGSGAGMDLILAAKKVGPAGRVIGLDMTPQMIEVAKVNLTKAGISNFEIRFGEMEKMPIEDGRIDWIISNCVINLSPEKERVFAEAFRVLKPGGQILVSDIVAQDLPQSVRDNLSAWASCISGAVEEQEYLRLVREAGFVEVQVVDRLVYDAASVRAMCGDDSCCCGPKPTELGPRQPVKVDSFEQYANRIASIKLSARKPL